ncbi:MAG: carboxypeptidase regulatory-like domain-containing protein [Bryobacterales bacterium]|nr:carboxypeptidase regulatory-like domain-containing protein [Bryobacterales bacterium]
MPDKGCVLAINLFDGARQPLASSIEALITVIDGTQRQVYRDFAKGPGLTIRDLPFHANFRDNYTVVAWASGHEQAGFTPIPVRPGERAIVDIMLLGQNASFNFSQARWDQLQKSHPNFAGLLGAGSASPEEAGNRYTELLERRVPVLACVFNLLTAMQEIHLPAGSPLDYMREMMWDDTMQQDRFFAWADPELVEQVRRAALEGEFAPEVGSAIFHTGATCSFKQVQFGEANVQITFHENDRKAINGAECIKVEPDMDYYKDPGAHALLEVLRNKATGSLTDPRQIYVLRWIAGRHAGVPEFNPPYTII